MDQIEVRLNDFLFNSGVLGFYKILKKAQKMEQMEIENNIIRIDPKVFENFEQDYISSMLYEYQKDTRWNTLVNGIEIVRKLELEKEEEKERLEQIIKNVKKAMESASYRSGYESIKEKQGVINPYTLLEEIKKEKQEEKRKENILKILEHVQQNKEIYCMKDIIYNKINLFWENVSFLNRSRNTKDIKQEYRKVFVEPVITYLQKEQKGDYTCIECGNIIKKSNAYSMGWLKDVGVDMNRKKAAYWNFKESTFLCPICNLIYSCIPLGFSVMGQTGIFINNNENIEMLRRDNNMITVEENLETMTIEKVYQKVFRHYLEETEQYVKTKFAEKEPQNIQVIKKDKNGYEFNIISKDKLMIFNKVSKDFEKIMNKSIYSKEQKEKIAIYDEVLHNFLQNKNQYGIIYKIHQCSEKWEDISYIAHILKIQLYSMGGIDLEDIKEKGEKLREAGVTLRKYFYRSKENENKLEGYIYQLINAVRTDNSELFMEIVFRMYSGRGLPAADSFSEIVKNKKVFKQLANEYIIGLKEIKKSDKEIKNDKGGNEDEE